ncbi:cell wall-associated NlpC family hydrolase [Kineosphaera limosa]|uniref:Putative peptidase C40 family protein n=1 Tax=Kineosphaera limosa NBRC 100340 TaxID=1184609 RepID=K6WQU7_9MICO|nr:C40 family peptidase [Kineosphaera limosa]NYE03150.1 cell wall-associated NlpC family hydrolase [Kineosphaera limosa]GAB94487.1 putative peptidase C40 family protein [Kineosphaera limosa NBRC 100340]
MKLLSAAPARLLATGVLAVGLSGGIASVSAPVAQAAPAAPTSVSVQTGLSSAQARSVLRIAASKKGTPYRYGAAGPNRFDCSGFTSWTFKRVGKSLPRTANQQYRASKKISRGQARPGDLVFYGGRNKHHVGIYAGNGKMWHSPRTGDVVKLSSVRGGASYGRVR